MKIARYGFWLGNVAHTSLLLAGVFCLYWLGACYPLQTDVTRDTLNSLEPGSTQVLQQMHGPVHLSVFSTEQDARLGDVRKLIRQFVALYQRTKPDITLSFIDPVKHPDEARNADIRANGEMVIEYEGRREHLTTLNEQALTSALLKLAHGQEQLVMYVTGHGERKLDGPANHDLGEFGKRLEHSGFHVGSLNLALAPDVPANASQLVITHPQADWLPGEVDKLMRYVDRGGNVLWLIDAEPLRGLQPLAKKLRLALNPGIVLDPDAEQMRAPATWALGSNYPPHPITRNFSLITAFPFARALAAEKNGLWQYHTVVEAAPRGWVSARVPKSAESMPRFDTSRDLRGPAAIAVALQRNIGGHEQRIVVVGSGSFLANTYAGNGGNLDLGVSIVNWLSNDDKLITIVPRAAKDHTVTLSRLQLAFVSIGTVIVLPLALGLVGGILWWRRRS